MKIKSLLFISLAAAGVTAAQADPSWTFKLPPQQLDAQYTVDVKAAPYIVMTKIPAKDSMEPWEGVVVNGCCKKYKVNVYTFTDAWYSKPWYNSPDTVINPDGSFKVDILTGEGNPAAATLVSLSLVPVTVETEIVTGARELPKSIVASAVFTVTIPR